MLAASGLLGTAILLATTPQAHHAPASTAGQLIIVAALLASLGPRSVRRAIGRSEPRPAAEIGSGEPTPLWHVIAIVALLSFIAGDLGGWDAGLRVAGGCVLVGAAQALILHHIVASDQRTTGRTYYRIAGSRILAGTRLGHTVGAVPNPRGDQLISIGKWPSA